MQLYFNLTYVGEGESAVRLHQLVDAFREMFYIEFSTYSARKNSEVFKRRVQKVEHAFQDLGFREASAVLEWLEDRQAYSKISSPRIIFILNKFLVLRQTERVGNQGQRAKCCPKRDNILHFIASSEFAKPLTMALPFSSRVETAKECLHRLELAKTLTAELIPQSSLLASWLSSSLSPELRALNALEKEMEIHEDVAIQLQNLNSRHLREYEKMESKHGPEEVEEVRAAILAASCFNMQ